MTSWTLTRRHCFALALVLGSVAAAPSGAAVFYVGLGTGCTHGNVSLAVAAAAANGPDLDIIRIASPSLFLGSLVEVNDQSVLLVGGFPNCTTATPTGRTALNRIGATDAFWVHGALSIERFFGLTNIDVVMGSSAGRALLLQDLANVLLDNSTLTDGQSTDQGGNVRMQGEVYLQILNRSEISYGSAGFGSGGGIHCEGGGTVYIDALSEVHHNSALDNGGGIFGYNCTITSSGWVYSNRASENGGGIYVAGGSTLNLTGGGPGLLSLVDRNIADNYGGGLFLIDAGTTVIARNAAIIGNLATVHAGGVWVGIGGASFTMDVDPTTCSIGRGCSLLADNEAWTGNAGALLVAGGSSATIRQTEISGNFTEEGGNSSVASVTGTLLIEGCEIRDNTRAGYPEVSRFHIFGTTTIAYSTIIETTVSAEVFWVWAGSSFKLFSSIVQADHTFHAPALAANIDCVITREQASFPAGGTFMTTVTDPALLFQNAAAGDYRLKRGSVAQDYCDTNFYLPVDGDIENQLRGFDDPSEPNLAGPFDLGADEWRPDIFADGFESGSTVRWSIAVP